MTTKIKVGISPCPNDTFIFKALELQHIALGDFEFEFHFHDVQTLNESIQRGEFDLVKISFGSLLDAMHGYTLLPTGGAMGYGCGPLLIQREEDSLTKGHPIYLPGKNTTARFLFDFWKSQQENLKTPIEYAFFDEIYRGLLEGTIQNGVIIHESRFVYKKDGFYLAEDLGAFWEKQTQFPIPLGGIVLKKDLHKKFGEEIIALIQQSLQHAWENPDLDLVWMQEKAQIPHLEVVKSHIKTYVNEFSSEIGPSGKRAIEFLLRQQNPQIREEDLQNIWGN